MPTGFGNLHVYILILHCMISLCSFGTIFRPHWFVAVSFQFPFFTRCMIHGPVFVGSAGFTSGGRKCFDQEQRILTVVFLIQRPEVFQ